MTEGRDLSPELAAEIAAPVLRPFIAIAIDTPDPVRAWTGKGTLPFLDEEWTGIEGIARIDEIRQGTDGSAEGVTATLYRVPSEFRDDLADQAVRDCGFRLYFGALDEAFATVRGHRLIFNGRLQRYDIADAGDELSVTVGGEGRSIDQRRPAIKRFTDEYQQMKHPGDRGFEYAARLTEIPILWARGDQAGL